MRTLSGRIVLPDGSVVAGRIHFDATISSIEPSGASSDFILPGFIDLQVNGSHGIDVMNASADGIIEISRKLAHEGTTAWLPTAVTSPIDHIEKVHRAIGDALERQQHDDRAGARTLGMHLEGPFISPMRLGAHPKLNLEPRGEAFERVMALEHLKLVTLAPELPEALEAIRLLTARGVVVSIGHTNATFEEASAGIAAGARMFTHLFNAMRPLNHRDPGVDCGRSSRRARNIAPHLYVADCPTNDSDDRQGVPRGDAARCFDECRPRTRAHRRWCGATFRRDSRRCHHLDARWCTCDDREGWRGHR
jgi:N-acetylglucosamine-6-phosphate deacetylase